MSAQYSSQLFRVSGLMDDDVAHRPGFTPGARIGSTLLYRIQERLPLREPLVVICRRTFPVYPADAGE